MEQYGKIAPQKLMIPGQKQKHHLWDTMFQVPSHFPVSLEILTNQNGM
jgi:hypothetical protein